MVFNLGYLPIQKMLINTLYKGSQFLNFALQ